MRRLLPAPRAVYRARGPSRRGSFLPAVKGTAAFAGATSGPDDELVEELSRCLRHLRDGALESLLVGARRLSIS